MPAADRLSATLSALADPTRRGILQRLSRGDLSPGALAEPLAMSQAAVSKHLKVLEGAGLVSRGREAQYRPCHLEAKPLREVSSWLDEYRRFWEGNFERLGEYLAELQRPARTAQEVRRGQKRARTGRAGKRPAPRVAPRSRK